MRICRVGDNPASLFLEDEMEVKQHRSNRKTSWFLSSEKYLFLKSGV